MAWLLLAATVGVIDVHAAISGNPTLSASFRRASRRHPVLVTVGTCYLLAHLYGALPRVCDPLSQLGGGIKHG